MLTRKEIQGYTLSEKLFESTRTIVYRGLESAANNPVVLKILNNDFPPSDDIYRISNEYKIAGNITLNGVIKFYDFINTGHSKAIVMEDIGGISLDKYIMNSKLDIQEILKIIISITDIISNIHNLNIIHKDINPFNIIINPVSKLVKVIDFSISIRIKREIQSAINPEKIEGTLAYISPEQTGRMNRSIDYRTDFYSLGITMYQMLTGELPFKSVDPMELLHSHIAILPEMPHLLNPLIPEILSKIVMKLISKNAEDRYQSTHGLKSDLEFCLSGLQKNGTVEVFEIGKSDISESLHIPEKLYGRNEEIKILFEEFYKAAQGETRLIFFAGPSGIGKTYLINEIHKPLIQKRGYFISGKFDKFRRDTPFSSFIQAFQDLIHQILAESEDNILTWKNTILNAIGDNTQLIIDIIPEIELLTGKQKSVPDINPAEAQNRFIHVFRNFIKSCADQNHPIIIFLDDLQWADSASLKLLNIISTGEGIKYLFMIGAYRDNEINNSNPLMLFIDELKVKNKPMQTITLSPLKTDQINELAAETLFKHPAETADLATLIKTKTDGNPFFVKEFIINLYNKNYITFEKKWNYDLNKIINANITDNVVVMMLDKVNKLTTETQEILKTAACIGITFKVSILSKLFGLHSDIILEKLGEAINEGMIIDLKDTLKFAHDRIREAVYTLMDKDISRQIHYNIGKVILSDTPDEKIDDFVFSIVYQLNLAKELITGQKEKIQLAKLNLSAGIKAKSSTAYESALEFFNHGVDLLTENSWETDYELTLSLYTEIGEAGYLTGDHKIAEKYFASILKNARSPLDKIKVYEVEMAINTSLHKTREALELGRNALKMFKVKMPPKASPIYIIFEIIKAKIYLRREKIEDIIDNPEITDANKLAIARIISACTEPCVIGEPDYLPIFILKLLNHSLKYGNSKYSSYAFASYGLILCGVFNDINNGYKFGELSIQLLNKFNEREFNCKIYFLFGNMISHWKKHLKYDIDFLMKGFIEGTETGDLAFASYSLNYLVNDSFFIGKPLEEVKENYIKYYEAIKNTKQFTAIQAFELWYQLVLNLMGSSTENVTLLKGEIFDEELILPKWIHDNDFNSQGFYTVGKQILYLFFGFYKEAVDISIKGVQSISSMVGMYFVAVHNFYYSLSLTCHYQEAAKKDQKKYLKQIKSNQKKMKKWAFHSPENYKHKFLLVEAELAIIKGNSEIAMDLYKQAIDLAAKNGFLQDEAIANELAAKFYIKMEMEQFAKGYLTRAYNCYKLWGAKSKTAELQKKYGHILT